MSFLPEPYEYVLFVDEAGDDGHNRVKPIDLDGGSEWLCIGGVLLRSIHEPEAVTWVCNIRVDIDARQRPALHYRKLPPTEKKRAFEILAEKPCRLFVAPPNKKNMRQHDSQRAARRGGRQRLCNYCVRLLMERVTDFCLKDEAKRFGEARYLGVMVSKRGGHSYGQTQAYREVLMAQAAGHSTFLSKREVAHQILRFNLVDHVP